MNPPLAVIRYLAALDAALAARGAPDRDQIVTQVAEHIAEALGEGPDADDEAVAGVLAELGDPQRIADEATGAGPLPHEEPRPQPTTGPDRRDPRWESPPYPAALKVPLLARPWIPVLVVVLWMFGAATAFGPVMLLSSGDMFVMPWATVVIGLLLDVPLIASIVLVVLSPLFRATGRVVWGLSVPVAVLVELIIGQSNVRYSPNDGDAAFAWALSVAVPVALVAAIIGITMRAYRRATPATPQQPGATRMAAAATG